jgi:transposase
LVGRAEIIDKALERIAQVLPENGGRGGQWQNHRKVVNGILWKLRAGAPWRDLPSRYRPWQTCYERFVGCGREWHLGSALNVYSHVLPAHNGDWTLQSVRDDTGGRTQNTPV